jgi:hypothetical protein
VKKRPVADAADALPDAQIRLARLEVHRIRFVLMCVLQDQLRQLAGLLLIRRAHVLRLFVEELPVDLHCRFEPVAYLLELATARSEQVFDLASGEPAVLAHPDAAQLSLPQPAVVGRGGYAELPARLRRTQVVLFLHWIVYYYSLSYTVNSYHQKS